MKGKLWKIGCDLHNRKFLMMGEGITKEKRYIYRKDCLYMETHVNSKTGESKWKMKYR